MTIISADKFKKGHARVDTWHRIKAKRPFEGFKDEPGEPFYDEELYYKYEALRKTRKLLDEASWRSALDKTGVILGFCKKMCGYDISNNLIVDNVNQQRDVLDTGLRPFYIVEAPKDVKGLEAQLFDFFFGGSSAPDEFGSRFDELSQYLKENKLGCHWSLLAYLSFMLDADYYFPLRSRTFDELLRFYEVPVRLEGNVSWGNYQKVRVMLEDLKVSLADRLGELPTTLEVQSYMWTLGRMLLDERKGTMNVSVRPIEKELDAAALREKRRKRATYREMIGLDGELKALAFEKNRLKQAGRENLAKQVALVAEDPSLGYDIESFDEAGNPKYIEVKSTNQTRASDQPFFLSENERQVATRLVGWCVYRVWDADKPVAHIEDLGNIVERQDAWQLDAAAWRVKRKG